MPTIKFKTAVIKSLDDLVEVFPSMTLPQIIEMYRCGLSRIKYYNDMLDPSRHLSDDSMNTVLDIIGFYLECTDFLAGYLARCFCFQNGYNMD